MPTSDPLALIATPLGEPGSGRIRYGAAMDLFHAGRLPEGALEVYRICSPLDGQDPAPLLTERGHVAPAGPAVTPSNALIRLLAEADRYLAGLSAPGVAEVRMGLAAAGPQIPTPPGAAPPVLAAHLPMALQALNDTHPALSAAIEAGTPHLHWLTYSGYTETEIGTDFARGHAYASLVGDGGPFAAGDFDFGLFIVAPHVLYRDHAHAAPELYAPLTGPHGWRFRPDAPLVLKPAHDPVWNDPDAPHLTKVGPLPFLCFYGWTRDAQSPARLIPATDWAELEALRL